MTNDLVCFTSSLVVQATEDVATFVSAREGHAVVHLAAAQGDERIASSFLLTRTQALPPSHQFDLTQHCQRPVAAVQTVCTLLEAVAWLNP